MHPIRIFRRLMYVTLTSCMVKHKRTIALQYNRKLARNSTKLFAYSVNLCGLFWNWYKSEDNDSPRKSSREKDNFIVAVTRKCAQSVVYIEIKDLKKVMPDTGQPMTASNGSGFIIDSNGWIMTNAHVVINRASSLVLVTTSEGVTYKAEVKDVDMLADLALLKIPAKNLRPLKMGDSGDINVGEWVVALGSPLSLSHTITAGIISSVNRDAAELGITNKPMKYIQTDAAITFGHSGGPLVNLDGEVIGINNLRITAGIAFAIPIDYAKEFLNRSSLMNPYSDKDGVVKKNLGVTLMSLNPSLITKLISEHVITVLPTDGALTHGVLVWKVLDYMPGGDNGLIVGDIITHLNGTEIYETSDVYRILSQTRRATFTITRNGKQEDVKIELNSDFN